MATIFQDGDRVRIVDREATAEDAKTGMFFNFFRGATGAVQKVYAGSEVAVELDLESVSEPIAARHLEVQEAMKTKWLDGLSEEARGRLTPAERAFRLHYAVLVAPADLEPSGPRAPQAAIESETVAETAADDDAAVESAHTARTTAEELDANETAELERRRGEASQ